MTEPMSRAPNIRRGRGWLWAVVIIWIVIVTGLWCVWPVEPRLTLRGDVDVIGITHDSQNLLALTRRATELDSQQKTYESEPSGPLQIWSLSTGQRHEVCIPDQACTGKLVVCNDGFKRMQEPSGKSVGTDAEFRRSLVLLTQYHPAGEDGVAHWQHFVFDSRTETIHQFQPYAVRFQSSQPVRELSPTGRWYSDRFMDRHVGPFRPLDRLAIFDTSTGKEYFAIGIDDDVYSTCFSADDRLFACSALQDEKGITRVWRMDTQKLVCTIDRVLYGLSFSQDGRYLAGFDKHPQTARVQEILIYDVATAAIVKQWAPEEPPYTHGGETLAFVDNDRWLLCYQQSLTGDGEFDTAGIRLTVAWDLTTGNVRMNEDYQAPNITVSYADVSRLPPPRFGVREQTLYEVPSGRQLMVISDDDFPLLLSADGRTLVLDHYRSNPVWEFLNRLNVPIPLFVQVLIGSDTNTWQVVDVPSGRTIGSLPSQGYAFWLSPDEKTLVTVSNEYEATSPDITIKVWDFPPRRPIVKPVAWSLVFPALVGVVVAIGRWRKRMKKPVSPS